MAQRKKGMALTLGILLLGSLFILNINEVQAQFTISGTVYEDTNMNGVQDVGEPPLTGADVFLNYPVGPSTVTLVGFYNFLNVQDGYHCIIVRMPGYKVYTRNVTVMGANVTVNFGLIPFESVTGRVIKADGTPIVGAHIEAYTPGAGPPAVPVGTALTDLYGNYVLTKIPPGTYDILCTKVEFLDQWRFNVRVDGRNFGGSLYNWHTTEYINFTGVSYDYGRISGFVLDAVLAPIVGALVQVPGLGLSTITTANGSYLIEGIPAGWYYVTARMNGYEIGVQFVCVSPGSAGATMLNPFELIQPQLPPSYIHGTVTDGTRAIENAVVEIPGAGYEWWIMVGGMPVPPTVPGPLFTDKAGYYIFANYDDPFGTYDPHPVLTPGQNSEKYYVVVRNEAGYVPDEWDNHHKTNARIVHVVQGRESRADFMLEENYDYKFGRVVNTDGIGIQGATVYVPNSAITTTTDTHGYFVLKLPSETYSENCLMDIRADEISYCGLFDDFQVNVVDPLPQPESEQPRRMYKAKFVIVAHKPDYWKTMEYYIPVPGGPGLGIPPGSEYPDDPCDVCVNYLRLVPHTGILKGQVLTNTGAPVTLGFVFVAGREVPLDSNGWYETHEVPVGSYDAAAIDILRTILQTSRGIAVQWDLVTIRNIVLPSTPPGLFVTGFVYSNRVRQSGGNIIDDTPYVPGSAYGGQFDPGEGIKDVLVETSYGGFSAYTDTYGFYIIQNISLPPLIFTTTLGAQKSGYISAANPDVAPLAVMNFVPGAPGTSGATVFPMSRFRGALKGRVVNEDGYDVSGAQVSIYLPIETIDETDTNGFYIFADVEYGSYILKICGGGECGIDYWTTFTLESNPGHGKPVTVNQPLSTADNVVRYKKKGRVDGYVQDSLGSPLEDAAVEVSGKHVATTDTMGYYTILNVPTGTHTGSAYRYGYGRRLYQDTHQTINLGSWWLWGVPFRANWTGVFGLYALVGPPITGSISGYVTLELTDGFCDAKVWLNPAGNITYTDSEGYYLFVDIFSQSLYVHATRNVGSNSYETATRGPLLVIAGVETKAPTMNLKRCTSTISGQVQDIFGVPLSGVQVTISDMHSTGIEHSLYGRNLSDYTTTTNATGNFEFVKVPFSDAQIVGGSTWAWTLVFFKTGYAVTVANAVVECTNPTSLGIIVMDPLCTIAGAVTLDSGCAAASISATQIFGGDEGSSTFGWVSSQTATNVTGNYRIEHLHPGMYHVTGTSTGCTLAHEPYVGANAVPCNYRMTTENVDFEFQAPPPGVEGDFSLSVSPPNKQIAAGGGSAQYTVTVQALNGFTGTINLAVSGHPTGNGESAPTFNPSTLSLTTTQTTATSTLTVYATQNTPMGYYTLTVSAAGGAKSHYVVVTLYVAGDFSLSVDPSSYSLVQGGTAIYNINVGSINGFSYPVTLSVTGLPSGATANFSVNPVVPAGASVLTVNTAVTTPVGSYPLVISGTGHGITHTKNVTLVVNALLSATQGGGKSQDGGKSQGGALMGVVGELARQAIKDASALKYQVEEIINSQEVPEDILERFELANSYLLKAKALFDDREYTDAVYWALKAIEIYKSILEDLQ